MGGGAGLVWFLVAAAILIVPFWRLLPEFGISRYFALLAVFPVVALVLLWVMAFSDRIGRREP